MLKSFITLDKRETRAASDGVSDEEEDEVEVERKKSSGDSSPDASSCLSLERRRRSRKWHCLRPSMTAGRPMAEMAFSAEKAESVNLLLLRTLSLPSSLARMASLRMASWAHCV